MVVKLSMKDKRKEECKSFLKKIQKGILTGILADFSIHPIIVVMDGLRKLRELNIFPSSLTAYKGLHLHTTSLADEIKAVDIALTHRLDMDDAIQYAVALSLKCESIVSFDKHFEGLKIPRKEPAELI